MTVRPIFLYALLLALGLVLWTNTAEAVRTPEPAAILPETTTAVRPWSSTEAVHECALKARELGLTVSDMRMAAGSRQGNLVLSGPRSDLRRFYSWLESDGRCRSILSFSMDMEDEADSRLSIVYQL